ncbi:redox-sensing transcriptional repressor Rex [Candidatus Poribacteria bacterium]|nr:redox-sensing transcriptional repressor Rex [Candidatus Poribacteria bacterium]
MGRKISTSGIYRLALYNRYISDLGKDDSDYVSSQELARATGHTAAQVRKDLTYYGSLGEPGKGYEIGKLKTLLTGIFNKDRIRNIIIVGVGNLGMALMAYEGFKSQQFNIIAAFDIDVMKIGKSIEGVKIHDIANMETTLTDLNAEMAIVSVPASSAQEVIDKLVSAGIKCILNFAPGHLNVPEYVNIHNVDLSIELDRLYYLLKNVE